MDHRASCAPITPRAQTPCRFRQDVANAGRAVSGVLGLVTFSNGPILGPAANQSLFTAGGAIGLAFQAVDRDWRVEFKGRWRRGLPDQRSHHARPRLPLFLDRQRRFEGRDLVRPRTAGGKRDRRLGIQRQRAVRRIPHLHTVPPLAVTNRPCRPRSARDAVGSIPSRFSASVRDAPGDGMTATAALGNHAPAWFDPGLDTARNGLVRRARPAYRPHLLRGHPRPWPPYGDTSDSRDPHTRRRRVLCHAGLRPPQGQSIFLRPPAGASGLSTAAAIGPCRLPGSRHAAPGHRHRARRGGAAHGTPHHVGRSRTRHGGRRLPDRVRRNSGSCARRLRNRRPNATLSSGSLTATARGRVLVLPASGRGPRSRGLCLGSRFPALGPTLPTSSSARLGGADDARAETPL